MATVPCPYCYHGIDSSALAFQCRGIGAPGVDGCRRAKDPERERRTGFVDEVLPTFLPESRWARRRDEAECPRCSGTTRVRACPVCHTPLPRAFVGSRSPMVGLVGGKGAGKTVYLTVLNQQLRTEVRRRFDADIRLVGDRQTGETSTKAYLERYENALFDHRQLFESTRAADGGRKEPLVLEWRQPRRSFGRERLQSTLLSFYDTAGEDLTSQATVHTQAYLGSAAGMIVLLDPWQLPGVRDHLDVPDAAVTGADGPLDVLTRVTELLAVNSATDRRGRVTTPIAVAFAKIDALFPELDASGPLFHPGREGPGYDEDTGRAIHEYVGSLLASYGADDIDALLRHSYRDFRYFAVSALGEPPNYEGKKVHARGVRPFRVEEPLLWLLHRLGVIDRSVA